MQFLTPIFLALAGIAGPIILLYMLRLRRREVKVSSVMLWQRLMQDREANAPWQRLRRNLLLLLQLMILAALVLALARPFVPVPSVAAGSVALLIDASASMQADDMPGGATRFEVAKEEARTLIGELGTGDVMTVIAAGTTPEVLTPPTTDRAILREAVNRADVSSAVADWDAALALAGASMAGRADARIVILSDGGLPDDLPPLPAEVRYVEIGREGSNLAISALATRALGDQPQLFAAVTNYGEEEAEVILSIEADGDLHTAEELSIAAGATEDVTITDLPETTQIIRAELTQPVEGSVNDYLAVDDVAYAVYAPPVGGRVLLVTDGNLFLEQVFSALPGVEGFRARPGELPEGEFDLIVFDSYLPEELPQTNLLIINPPSSTNLFVVGGEFDNTRFVRQADDPIMAFVDFGTVAVREAKAIQTPGWAQVLVEAEGGPLLLAGETGGRRVAVMTFDLHASDLVLRIDYPILIANLLGWFAPAEVIDTPDGLEPGQPVVVRPQATTDAYRVRYPDGTADTFNLDGGALTFPDTSQLGIYTVDLLSGGQSQGGGAFAINLFSDAESMIAPVAGITIGQAEVTAAGQEGDEGQRELWPWLAGAAVVVLIIEWWVYHRGSALPNRQRDGRGLLGFVRGR